MVNDFQIIGSNKTAKEALIQLEKNTNKKDIVLCVKDKINETKIGTITEKEIRRGIMSSLTIENEVRNGMRKEIAENIKG